MGHQQRTETFRARKLLLQSIREQLKEYGVDPEVITYLGMRTQGEDEISGLARVDFNGWVITLTFNVIRPDNKPGTYEMDLNKPARCEVWDTDFQGEEILRSRFVHGSLLCPFILFPGDDEPYLIVSQQYRQTIGFAPYEIVRGYILKEARLPRRVHRRRMGELLPPPPGGLSGLQIGTAGAKLAKLADNVDVLGLRYIGATNENTGKSMNWDLIIALLLRSRVPKDELDVRWHNQNGITGKLKFLRWSVAQKEIFGDLFSDGAMRRIELVGGPTDIFPSRP